MLLALTSITWLLDVFIVFIAFQAIGLTLPFVAAMVTGALLCIGMMIPAAPAFIGTYQFFAITGLQLYYVPESQAFATAVFLNLLVVAVSTLFGLLALSVEAVDWLVSMAARCMPEGVE